MAAALWGRRWAGKTVRAQCDNAAVVAIVNPGSSREPEAMHLLRCLAFLEAKFSFYMFATHIRGLTDALSRNKITLFHSLYPQAKKEPVDIPAAILDLLVVLKPDWTSHTWTQLWNSSSVMVHSTIIRLSQEKICSFLYAPQYVPCSDLGRDVMPNVSYLALQKLSHSTIKCYLAAVRHLHIAERAGDPEIAKIPRLEQVLRGVKLTQAKGNKKGKVRLPISIDILGKMRDAWQGEASQDTGMLWAAALVCFLGFMRSGELAVPSEGGYDEGAHLSFQDVTVDNLSDPQVLQIRLKASKTDPFRLGWTCSLAEPTAAYAPLQLYCPT